MNLEIAKQAIDVIRDHQDWHNQSNFVNMPLSKGLTGFEVDEDRTPPCGTTLCFAGFVALLNAPVRSVVHDGGYLTVPGTGQVYVDHYATEILETESETADAFYYDAETLEDLEKLVNYLEEHPGAGRDTLWTEALGRSLDEMED